MFRRYYNYRWKNPIAFLLGGLLSLSPSAFAETGDNPGIAVDLKTAILRVAKENIRAVVRIEVARRQEVLSPRLPFEDDPAFRYSFDFSGSTSKKFKTELKGLGTGMMMDSCGYILTSYHIVAKAAEIRVMLSDGIQCKATLVDADSETDLAIIRIEGKDSLPHVNFGDSDKIDLGDWEVALGFPLGLDPTVTLTVQHKDKKYGRSVKILELQSAGKRFDSFLKDRVGVVVRTVTSKETQKYNLEVGQGVAIVWLEPSGSLKRAGFELGDIILEINSKPVDSLKSFVDLVSPLESNERIILLALDHRTGQKGYVEVVVR